MHGGTIEQIKGIVDKVDGYLKDREGILLYNLAQSCKGRGVIVEIGSWKGKSTIWLGKGSKMGRKVKVYAIDPHSGSSEHRKEYGEVWTFPEFSRNIKKAEIDDIVVPIVKTSAEASGDFAEPVELLFIDGAHEYEFVRLDFELWYPKLIDGGIMAFHDTRGWPGPKRVVNENLSKFKNRGVVDEITYGQKLVF